MENISWQDYDNLDGFGGGALLNPENIESMNKALFVGSDTNAPGSVTPGDGFALRVESLERNLKNTSYRMEHLKFFKSMPKIPAYNSVEEFNVLSSYGQADESWVADGQLPEEDDSSYERKYAKVKVIGTTRRVSHMSTLIKPAHGNIVDAQTVQGTMHILRMLEAGLYNGDSSLSALQFDGYAKMIEDMSPATNIVDMRGQPLDEDVLVDLSLTISDAPNYGIPTHLHCNPKVKADLVKTFFPKERVPLGEGPKGGMLGFDIDGFTSPAGDVKFESNVFITDGGAPGVAVGDSAKRPASPVISTAATTPADVASLFGADDAGSYFYKIVAHNDFGRSAAVAVDAGAIAVLAGDKVTFGVTPGGGPAVKWYSVYRTKKAGASGTERRILRVANTAGVGALTINDFNESLPYCTNAYLWQQNAECMAWKQLAPLLKIPLATTEPSVRWLQLLYGVPVLYTPGKAVLIKNVGRSVNYRGAP